MTQGLEQLAACTTHDELRAVKSILEVESANAAALGKEYTLKSNEYRVLANQCKIETHDVVKLIKDKGYEIEYG